MSDTIYDDTLLPEESIANSLEAIERFNRLIENQIPNMKYDYSKKVMEKELKGISLALQQMKRELSYWK